MRNTKVWIGAALLVAGIGAGVAVHEGLGRANVRAPELSSLRELVAPGKVEAVGETLALAFEQAGRVDGVQVHEGERVEQGQLLARLDDRLARARVARADAALLVAQARRDAALRGARPEELRQAEGEAASARAQAQERALVHDRASRLVSEAAISRAEADSADLTATAAAGQASAAEARLALLRKGTRDEQKREALAQVTAAEAELEEARVLLSQTELRAPAAGTVLRRLVEPGEQVIVLPPTVVVALADTGHLQLRAEVDEADVGHVAVGQSGYATAETFGERRVPGKIVRIMGELGRKRLVTDDPRARVDTRVLEVLFVPDGPHPGLPLGLRMDVHLAEPEGLAVAAAAPR